LTRRTNDPTPGNDPKRDWARLTPQAITQRLNTVIRQSRFALFVERAWRGVFPPLIVSAFFVGVSWLGLWLVLPVWLRVIFLIGFLAALIWSARGLLDIRWPSRAEALARVERDSGVDHRPLTAFEDELSLGGEDPASRALWDLHKKRTSAALAQMKAKRPDPQAFRLDPFAFRVAAVMLLVVGYMSSGADRWARLGTAFQAPVSAQDIASRLDAWVTPPLYTDEPPLYLTGESAALRDPNAPVSVPEGSIVNIRAQGLSGLSVAFSRPGDDGPEAVLPPPEEEMVGEDAPFEITHTLSQSGSLVLSRGRTEVSRFQFTVRPDDQPEIRLTDDPEQQLSGALKFSYLVQDDYGVIAAEAKLAPAPDTSPNPKVRRPLVEAPRFPLSLPPRSSSASTGETIRDLTSHPWAGSEVDLTLISRDEAGQEGYSPAYRITLPQRRFRKPLARAIVEQRRDLALDANNHVRVITAFDSLMIAPEAFDVGARVYLGMDYAFRQVVAAQTDDELKELLPLLWDLALTIEDGDLSMAERALREAQEALRDALENGASDEEIERLTQELREALNDYMQALAEQMRNNPQAMQPFNSQQQNLSQQDLSQMLDRIEELARTGSRDAARELLAQMQQMLENLQAGRPQQMPDGMTSEMMEMLNELGEMIQQQQQLMDQTHQFNQNQQQQGQQGQQGQQQQGQGQQQMTAEQLQQMLDQLQQGQGDLAQQLQQLMDQLGQNGMGENNALGEAGNSMGQAQQSLGQGQGQQALGQQGDALDALRRGAQGMAQQMMGQGEGPGMAQGRSPLDEDPLGRPRRTEGPDFGNRVQVPDEIDVQRARRILEELRRRFSDPDRPQIELDYLERLLRRY